MRDRRMISNSIVDTDMFIEMPFSTQCLYFHLVLKADDDGFISSPKKIMKSIGANECDLETLIEKDYVIKFKSGIIVLIHWKMHNTIQKDRYTTTEFQNELSQLDTEKSKKYVVKNDVSNMYPRCIQDVSNMDTNKVSNKVSNKCVDETGTHTIFKDFERNKLKKKYPKVDIEKWIEHFNSYCLEHNKQYKDSYSVLCTWINKEPKKYIMETGSDHYYDYLLESSGN